MCRSVTSVRTSPTWWALQEERLLLAHSQRGSLQGALHRWRPHEAVPCGDAAAACAVGIVTARQQQAGHLHVLLRRCQPSCTRAQCKLSRMMTRVLSCLTLDSSKQVYTFHASCPASAAMITSGTVADVQDSMHLRHQVAAVDAGLQR